MNERDHFEDECIAQMCDDETQEELEDLQERMLKIQQWCDAYPIDIFPEPTPEQLSQAREAVESVGITFDALHASWARHILDGISKLTNKRPSKSGDKE